MYAKQVWPFKWGDFGPVHACPKCGMMIQYVQRRGGNVPEEMLTGGRHHCEHIKGEPLPHYLQCICGTHVIEKHGQRYNLAGQLHRHDAPKPLIVFPHPMPQDNGDKLPEGFVL